MAGTCARPAIGGAKSLARMFHLLWNWKHRIRQWNTKIRQSQRAHRWTSPALILAAAARPTITWATRSAKRGEN
uniref:Uncharacterized protein n=1 Tax=Macrostomum lignano TaxID=282301 RepID=A0A1I8FBA5_9PLAT